MSIVNFGSINIDFVYRVQRLVLPGETVQTQGLDRFAGGKGFNQSIALARAGCPVRHVGSVGEDGRGLVEMLEEEGVDTRGIDFVATPTGHAIIQVDSQGENSILVHAGANRDLPVASLEDICGGLGREDWLLLQNETNAPGIVLKTAAAEENRVVFNPSPLDPGLLELPLDRVDTFLINSVEGEALSGETEPARILDAMKERFPAADVVLTLGARGVHYAGQEGIRIEVAGDHVQVLDTTGAGDTFAGYFLAEMVATGDPEIALRLACRAAGLCVTRSGAAPSIPHRSELEPIS